MKKLTIRKKAEAKGSGMNLLNYDILADGESIDGNCLMNITIGMECGSKAKVTLEYYVRELEINGLPVEIVNQQSKKGVINNGRKSI